MKVSIDIEDLLIWAYRDQCIDRVRMCLSPQGPSASIAGALGEMVQLGTRVDTSGAAARALGGFRVPDDAIIVHDTVLGLGEWFVEWTAGDGCEVWDHARAESEGRRIVHDGEGWRLSRLSRSGREADAAMLERVGLATLIIPHARTGMRPEWHAGWVGPVARGRPALTEVDRRGRRRAQSADPLTALILRDRAQYGLWHAALACLAVVLEGALARFAPCAPAAPERPWDAAAARILDAQAPAGQNDHARKALKRRRKTA